MRKLTDDELAQVSGGMFTVDTKSYSMEMYTDVEVNCYYVSNILADHYLTSLIKIISSQPDDQFEIEHTSICFGDGTMVGQDNGASDLKSKDWICTNYPYKLVF